MRSEPSGPMTRSDGRLGTLYRFPRAPSRVTGNGRSHFFTNWRTVFSAPLSSRLTAKNSTRGPQAANATVTLCHSRTQNLNEVCRSADVIVAAIGVPKFITADMVKPGAVVVDVGINRTDDGLCGDVDFDTVKEVAGHLTPVPGGVGPLTVTMLMYNTLDAAKLMAR